VRGMSLPAHAALSRAGMLRERTARRLMTAPWRRAKFGRQRLDWGGGVGAGGGVMQAWRQSAITPKGEKKAAGGRNLNRATVTLTRSQRLCTACSRSVTDSPTAPPPPIAVIAPIEPNLRCGTAQGSCSLLVDTGEALSRVKDPVFF
jgi:hypothetical protein